MKKIITLLLLIFLNSYGAHALRIAVPDRGIAVEQKEEDDDVDTSIVDELKKGQIQELHIDFKLKTFKSCENLENVMEKYIKDYYRVNQNRYKKNRIHANKFAFLGDSEGATLDTVNSPAMMEAVSAPMVMQKSKSISQSAGAEGSSDFAKTNSQVQGVDESDIIKTDGKYVYYYNATKKYVYIIEAYGTPTMKILKKIKLPKTFRQPVLYIANNKLIIVATGYSSTNYSSRGYYINRKSKTYTIVFDTTNKVQPQLEKLYVSDGNLIKSRKIGKYLYVISNNNFSIPYHNFKSVDDINININSILPKKLELSKTSVRADQNFKIKGKAIPFSLRAGNIAKCSDIEYSLPDTETLKKIDFNPSYNIISIIDIEDSSKEVKTKLIAGSNSEIYMSINNLYLTESIYQRESFSCAPGSACIMPMYWGDTHNTILHKMNISGNDMHYKNSTLLPGKPLTQYSMDEKDEKFRIITSTNNWGQTREQHTDLFILDTDLTLISSLNNLGKNENFKSSRFMGDKLFLVTFKQVDPLYAIDLADMKNPKILGELKIPGYSEYLHPYDSNHLIGLGRDTFDVSGRTKNGGLKIDLYEVNYDKKCGDSDLSADEKEKCKTGDYKGIIVKQKFSKVLGDQGSHSEATRNPRMFMWNASKNLLFLPATLYTKMSKTSYKTKDFFQGLVTLSIDKDTGISEKYRITHIDYKKAEEARLKECSKYSENTPKEKQCRKLIDGSNYCPPVTQKYVPEYCYAEATVGSYIARKSGSYRTNFIKRALWIGENVYSISDSEIGKIDMSTGTVKNYTEMK